MSYLTIFITILTKIYYILPTLNDTVVMPEIKINTVITKMY
jgi:hypothetical protein